MLSLDGLLQFLLTLLQHFHGSLGDSTEDACCDGLDKVGDLLVRGFLRAASLVDSEASLDGVEGGLVHELRYSCWDDVPGIAVVAKVDAVLGSFVQRESGDPMGPCTVVVSAMVSIGFRLGSDAGLSQGWNGVGAHLVALVGADGEAENLVVAG